jgi:hypothetical protein
MWSDEWLALQKQVDELAAEQLEINLLKQKQIITDADIYKPLQEQQAVSLNVTRDWFAKERAMIHDFVVVVQDIAGGIGQALVQGLQGSMDGWRDVLKNILISVVDMIERYIVLAKIKALVDAVINPWSALKTAAPLIAAMAGLEAVKGAIYAMADGTVVTRPTLALVGEAGPEIVAPKQDFMSYSRQLMEEAAAGRSGGSVTRNEQKLTMNFNSPLTDRRQARRLTDNVMRPAMRRDAKRAGRLQDKS